MLANKEDFDYYMLVRRAIDDMLNIKFDLPYYNFPYIGDAYKLERLFFINGVRLKIDLASLPPKCVDAECLSFKFVLYGIWCNGKLYIGKTDDFGERMITHIRDSQKNGLSQQLYYDMKKHGEAFCFVFGIFDTQEQLDAAETEAIAIAKEMSVKRTVNFDEDRFNVFKTMNEQRRNRERKYCYNIQD